MIDSKSAPTDCVIVGAGVAGLSAALFLGRASRSTVLYDGGEPRIFAVEELREWLGFDGVPTAEAMERCRAEVLRYGVEIRPEKVDRIVPRDDGWFDVTSPSGIVTSRTVVLATGLVDDIPHVSGVPKAWGRDLRVCPCFDGYEVRNGRFVVFGPPERLAHQASWVRMWSPDVTVISRHDFNEADAERLRLLDIGIVRDEVASLVYESDRLVAVTTHGGHEVACDAAWITSTQRAASDLAASLCEVDGAGIAKTDKVGATSRPGVWAIGTANEPWAHLAHASAAGTGVGPVVTFYLLEQLLAERRTAETARRAA